MDKKYLKNKSDSKDRVVKMFSPYFVTYDKHIPGVHGSTEVERVTIKADTKDIALRRMKKDVYSRGLAGVVATAKLPNGEIFDFKVYKKPKKDLTVDEIIRSRVVSRSRSKYGQNFGKFDLE